MERERERERERDTYTHLLRSISINHNNTFPYGPTILCEHFPLFTPQNQASKQKSHLHQKGLHSPLPSPTCQIPLGDVQYKPLVVRSRRKHCTSLCVTMATFANRTDPDPLHGGYVAAGSNPLHLQPPFYCTSPKLACCSPATWAKGCKSLKAGSKI